METTYVIGILSLFVAFYISNFQPVNKNDYDLGLDIQHEIRKNEHLRKWASYIGKDARGTLRTVDLLQHNSAARALAPPWLSSLTASELEELKRATARLQQKLLLRIWLRDAGLVSYAPKLETLGLKQLEDAYWLEDHMTQPVFGSGKDWTRWLAARTSLPFDPAGLEDLKADLWLRLLQQSQPRSWTWAGGLLLLMGAASLWTWQNRRDAERHQGRRRIPTDTSSGFSFPLILTSDVKTAFLRYLRGLYAVASQARSAYVGKTLASHAKTEFLWDDPCTVGSTVTFTVQFFTQFGRPYPISDADGLVIEVLQGVRKLAVATEFDSKEASLVRASFFVRKAGVYSINVMIAKNHVTGSPFHKSFIPGKPDLSKTALIKHSSMVVCTAGMSHQLHVEPRDEFDNLCSFPSAEDFEKIFSLQVEEVGSLQPVKPFVEFLYIEVLRRLVIQMTLFQDAIYHAQLKHRGDVLEQGDFDIIVLNSSEASFVQKALRAKSHWWESEAKMHLNGGANEKGNGKTRKVFCCISPRQLTIREYILGLIPKRIMTFRVSPSTKFTFRGSSNQYELPSFSIDDGSQNKVDLLSKDCSVIVAVFVHHLLKNIGGSESFKDKQEFFYHELRKLHQKRPRDKLPLRVSRERLLEMSMRATKGFSVDDWCKNFEVSFVGELAIDYGGVRREWFDLICSILFDPKQGLGLFTHLSNEKSSQALVHPNSNPPSQVKLKYYEWAGKIVGKCLYESSLGGGYRQLVRARFTRSFLAQLIGLRVHYKYFEQDDPELYLSKIRYIKENDMDNDMELYFAEDEYDAGGQLTKTIDLIPNGSKSRVTNANKFEYLNALAQYKLSNNVKDQLEAFLKGLNTLVPDNLLGIFDENELELLICGTTEYSLADFKANHTTSGSTSEFRKVLDWFWTSVANFDSEEMSRLLQFTTGCSQLPPGGFGELVPKFQITAAPSVGNLPTAHTCFNQLCLPDYESYEQFEKAFLVAIKEGSEGFGMA